MKENTGLEQWRVCWLCCQRSSLNPKKLVKSILYCKYTTNTQYYGPCFQRYFASYLTINNKNVRVRTCVTVSCTKHKYLNPTWQENDRQKRFFSFFFRESSITIPIYFMSLLYLFPQGICPFGTMVYKKMWYFGNQILQKEGSLIALWLNNIYFVHNW